MQESIQYKTIVNLRNTALGFFFFIGLIHIISGIILENQYLQSISYFINRTFDIPFIISGLAYGLASVKLFFIKHDYNSKIGNSLLILVMVLVFLILIYFNLFTPDK